MIYLAIDADTKLTGIGWVGDKIGNALLSSKGMLPGESLKHLFDNLVKILKDVNPDVVAIEEPAGQSRRGLTTLGRLVGIAELALWVALSRSDIERIYNQTWRAQYPAISCAKGTDNKKRAAREHVKSRMDLSVGSDIADALCIAMYLQERGTRKPVVKKKKSRSSKGVNKKSSLEKPITNS